MFSTSEQFSRAARALFDNQEALFDHSVHAWFDAGTHTAEANAETIRTLYASTTVAMRQWLGAGGAYDWLNLAAHQPHLGWTSMTAVPAGARHQLVSGPAMAA
jgi:hypothetical protein